MNTFGKEILDFNLRNNLAFNINVKIYLITRYNKFTIIILINDMIRIKPTRVITGFCQIKAYCG